jgi:hypothetical protein
MRVTAAELERHTKDMYMVQHHVQVLAAKVDSLTTENATLKETLARHEKVIAIMEQRLAAEEEQRRLQQALLWSPSHMKRDAFVLSDENTVVTSTTRDWSTVAMEAVWRDGIHSFEVLIDNSSGHMMVGVVPADADLQDSESYIGRLENSGCAIYTGDGEVCYGSASEKLGEPITSGSRVGVRADIAAGKLEFFVDGQSVGGFRKYKMPAAVRPAVSFSGANDTATIVARPSFR